MWETTSGLTRVALLVLVTSSFAAVWNSDQHTQSAFALARLEGAQPSCEAVVERHQCMPDETTISHTSSDVEHAPQRQCAPATDTMQVTVEMTLPSDIAPGRYRVVQPSGAMFTIRVSASEQTTAIPRDLYVAQGSGGGRQCFVRIADPHAQSAGVEVTAELETPTRR